MVGRTRVISVTAIFCVSVIAIAFVATLVSTEPASGDPPEDQEYVGSKRCGSCHLDQYIRWRATPHAKAFSLLTEKYEEDPTCLKCHTTGYGEKTGYGAIKDDSLKEVGCEVCHGPGSKHDEAAQPFANVKNLTKEQEELIRGTIWKVLPRNVCLDCHLPQGHGELPTPPELKRKKKDE